MGFNANFVNLVKGFTVDAKAKVHINGAYTQEISLQRGVRQGCPLAPLLFAMCTQPFMQLIQKGIQDGMGIQITPGKSLVHQLFADDTGLFLATRESEFQELLRILKCMNWHQTLSVVESRKFERLIRDFLWGSNPDGRPKKPLVSWKWLLRPKDQGGLGFMSFAGRVRVLQMRYLADILTRYLADILSGRQVEWADMVRCMLQVKLRIGPNKVERRNWEPEDALLLLSAFRFPEALTVDKLLRSWFFFKKKLCLPPTFTCPKVLHIKNLKLLWQLSGHTSSQIFPWIESEMKRRKLLLVGDFVATRNSLLNEEQGLARIPGMEISDLNIAAFNWLSCLEAREGTLKEIQGWTWGQLGRCLPGWR
ncbi:hypothetical protein R1sor_018863 [Riccia sorocarpa]|uniref:Reverse transcriptase domain-containing protein n=1 Tax=Riccia sorocarpa TaxID=122646 RepID=A0ABD3IF09_9MARC